MIDDMLQTSFLRVPVCLRMQAIFCRRGRAFSGNDDDVQLCHQGSEDETAGSKR